MFINSDYAPKTPGTLVKICSAGGDSHVPRLLTKCPATSGKP